MLTYKTLVTDKSIVAFVGLNLADLALTLLVLSWGGVELNPVYASLSDTSLIPQAKLTYVCLTLLVLWYFRKLYLIRWLNVGLVFIVAFNITMASSKFI
jgi:hypothetical protein